MEDHSGAEDSTAGAVEIWAASTSKMRSCAASAAWSASSRKGPFGQPRTGLAGSDELAGKLDQVGREVDRSVGVFEGRRVAEGDLFIESKAFGLVERI